MNFDNEKVEFDLSTLNLQELVEVYRNWIKKNNMPAHKIGRQWKFKLSEVDDWVKSGKSAIDS